MPNLLKYLLISLAISLLIVASPPPVKADIGSDIMNMVSDLIGGDETTDQPSDQLDDTIPEGANTADPPGIKEPTVDPNASQEERDQSLFDQMWDRVNAGIGSVCAYLGCNADEKRQEAQKIRNNSDPQKIGQDGTANSTDGTPSQSMPLNEATCSQNRDYCLQETDRLFKGCNDTAFSTCGEIRSRCGDSEGVEYCRGIANGQINPNPANTTPLDGCGATDQQCINELEKDEIPPSASVGDALNKGFTYTQQALEVTSKVIGGE